MDPVENARRSFFYFPLELLSNSKQKRIQDPVKHGVFCGKRSILDVWRNSEYMSGK